MQVVKLKCLYDYRCKFFRVEYRGAHGTKVGLQKRHVHLRSIGLYYTSGVIRVYHSRNRACKNIIVILYTHLQYCPPCVIFIYKGLYFYNRPKVVNSMVSARIVRISSFFSKICSIIVHYCILTTHRFFYCHTKYISQIYIQKVHKIIMFVRFFYFMFSVSFFLSLFFLLSDEILILSLPVTILKSRFT